MKKTHLFGLATMFAGILGLSGCSTNDFGEGWNTAMTVFMIIAGAVLLFFVVYGIVSAVYKGKVVNVKVLRKIETQVLRGNSIGKGTPGMGGGRSDLSRRARRQKTRMRFNKVIAEVTGDDGEMKEKTLRVNDIVLLDKLIVGKVNRVRVRFGEIIKIVK